MESVTTVKPKLASLILRKYIDLAETGICIGVSINLTLESPEVVELFKAYSGLNPEYNWEEKVKQSSDKLANGADLLEVMRDLDLFSEYDLNMINGSYRQGTLSSLERLIAQYNVQHGLNNYVWRKK